MVCGLSELIHDDKATVPRPAALVTGAARGIGRAIALALAGGGFDVAVNDVATSSELAKTVADIEAIGRTPSRCRRHRRLAGHAAMLDTGRSSARVR